MQGLSTAQKLVKFFASEDTFERMRLDSQKWCFKCVKCTETSSLWDVGGIRYKAKGNPNMRIRCPKCTQVSVQTIFRLEEDEPQGVE